MAEAVERTLIICSGGDCADDQRSAHRKLRDAASEAGVRMVESRCLGVCHGPVAVVAGGRDVPVVVRRVRKGRARRAVIDLCRGAGSGPADVVTGKKAAKAARRAARVALPG